MFWDTNFCSCFWTSTQICQKNGQKANDNFSDFGKHRLWKHPFCCNPPFDQKLLFFNLSFWNQQHWCWTKNITNHQKKSTDKRKGFQREKTRQETPEKRKDWWKKLCNHETKAKKTKKNKESDKNKEPKECKKERQEGRNKEKNKGETEKEKLRKGEAETLRRNKGRHSKINKKCPF